MLTLTALCVLNMLGNIIQRRTVIHHPQVCSLPVCSSDHGLVPDPMLFLIWSQRNPQPRILDLYATSLGGRKSGYPYYNSFSPTAPNDYNNHSSSPLPIFFLKKTLDFLHCEEEVGTVFWLLLFKNSLFDLFLDVSASFSAEF